ncbi:MAG: EscU/YscU/HrcU family type III secretion system export apparatus switch protein [Synergistetes bacterium]|nr:EscU/YscU/HrcU family type III secretion system export apparatus switch protein [Synergistota bacterium]
MGKKEDVKKAAALKYDILEDEAPYILYVAQGLLAEKMVELAEKYEIPVYKDEALADVLLKIGEGKYIPPELYQAVAQVLAFVYWLDKNG